MGILVDLETMKTAVKDPGIVKLDVRDVDEWDCRELLAIRQGFLPAQGTHPRRLMDRMVPDDEADAERSDV
jgi:hypothetical protein